MQIFVCLRWGVYFLFTYQSRDLGGDRKSSKEDTEEEEEEKEPTTEDELLRYCCGVAENLNIF